MAESGDAFGAALADALAGGEGQHVIERDDGLVEAFSARPYLEGTDAFGEIESDAMDAVAGRLLDIGAGAGRFSLAAQERGLDVVALDDSPGALEVCLERGVRQTVLSSIHTFSTAERFDTFLMMGHNLGLLGPSPVRTLRRLADLAAPGARILSTSLDPAETADPTHLAYHARNRHRGRRIGHVVLRVRTKALIGPWFDYLFMSFEDLSTAAADAGWTASLMATQEPHYLARLDLSN